MAVGEQLLARTSPRIVSWCALLLFLTTAIQDVRSFCPSSVFLESQRSASAWIVLQHQSTTSSASRTAPPSPTRRNRSSWSAPYKRSRSRPDHPCARARGGSSGSRSTTALHVLLDVPDGFFSVTFPVLGILLSFSKSFARIRMEERAWEQRLTDGRRRQLAQDPTLTELDVRRLEAAQEWSAYGKPRWEEEQAAAEQQRNGYGSRGTASRVGTATKQDPDPAGGRDGLMSDEEIARFESLYGIEYDPYYDDPYTEEELPMGKFNVDKRYGDRVYSDGEVFYKTAEGLYYRQGAKPRNWKFW